MRGTINYRDINTIDCGTSKMRKTPLQRPAETSVEATEESTMKAAKRVKIDNSSTSHFDLPRWFDFIPTTTTTSSVIEVSFPSPSKQSWSDFIDPPTASSVTEVSRPSPSKQSWSDFIDPPTASSVTEGSRLCPSKQLCWDFIDQLPTTTPGTSFTSHTGPIPTSAFKMWSSTISASRPITLTRRSLVKQCFLFLKQINDASQTQSTIMEADPETVAFRHMQAERKRRQREKECMKELKSLIPTINKDKVSILEATIEHIKVLESQTKVQAESMDNCTEMSTCERNERLRPIHQVEKSQILRVHLSNTESGIVTTVHNHPHGGLVQVEAESMDNCTEMSIREGNERLRPIHQVEKSQILKGDLSDTESDIVTTVHDHTKSNLVQVEAESMDKYCKEMSRHEENERLHPVDQVGKSQVSVPETMIRKFAKYLRSLGSGDIATQIQAACALASEPKHVISVFVRGILSHFSGSVAAQHLRDFEADLLYPISLPVIFQNKTIILGRETPEGNLEFVFPTSESMSSIVGVSVQFAKVLMQNDVEIEGIAEREWETIWEGVFDSTCTYTPLLYSSQQKRMDSHVPLVLTGKDVAGLFGVGLNLDHHLNELPSLPNFGIPNPCLWEVVKLFLDKQVGCVQHAPGSGAQGRNANVNGDFSASSSLECLKQGEESGLVKQLYRLYKRRNGDGDGDGSNNGANRNVNDDRLAKKVSSFFSRVKVKPGSGGRFFNSDNGQVDVNDECDLTHVCITPTLVFHFQREDMLRTIEITLDVICDLGNAAPKPKREQNNRFGWYHDNIKISMECTSEGSAIIEGNSTRIEVGEISKATQKHTIIEGENKEYGARIKATGRGNVGFASISMGAEMQASNATSRSSNFEQAIEIPLRQDNGGWSIQNTTVMRKARLSYHAFCPVYVPDTVVLDERDRLQFLAYGICKVFSKSVADVWTPLDYSSAIPYVFQAERYLIEKTLVAANIISSNGSIFTRTRTRKQKDQVQESFKIQKHKVEFLVNHAMTHLDNKAHDVSPLHRSVPNIMAMPQEDGLVARLEMLPFDD